ncbi:hypothetical protein [Mesorhizobium sp. B2-4-13]|uniref:hypothetical protein n=1 Tax=Mesorhizobium sp. B2-4-13 TaxID=2589936 RepID=UPI0015EF50F8|nr:hypothetical protein [Mesorhizobium sp. B2-4-13]
MLATESRHLNEIIFQRIKACRRRLESIFENGANPDGAIPTLNDFQFRKKKRAMLVGMVQKNQRNPSMICIRTVDCLPQHRNFRPPDRTRFAGGARNAK